MKTGRNILPETLLKQGAGRVTGEEIKVWTEKCLDELETKQNDLRDRFGLGEMDSYSLDREKGVLVFEKQGEPVYSFKAVPVGTLVPDNQNWLWGWANESLPEKMREASAKLKDLHQETGFALFAIEAFKGDRTLAQEFSALAVHYLAADGLYRVSGESTILYLALSEGEKLKK